jgi:hypothetical protein
MTSKEGLIPMSDFIVRFHGIALSPEHEQRVQASIQKAVLAEVAAGSIAGYTPDPDGTDIGGSLAFLPNHIWRGIIYLPAAALRADLTAITEPLTVVTGQRQE